MPVFQQVLWGYELTYPDDWTHRTLGDAEGFAALERALEPDYDGPRLGHLLVRAEWNCARQPIGPLWNEHIARAAGMLGAKRVGSAPWTMGGATGFEAEIVLSKREDRRLWTGILARGMMIVHLMVVHRPEERGWFEPPATSAIRSLRFLDRAPGLAASPQGLPLPPAYASVAPSSLVDEIADPHSWEAFDAEPSARASIGALQAFFLRELPAHGWEIDEYAPFPTAGLGFARLNLRQGERTAALGILPCGEQTTPADPARLAIKYG